jgi:integrase
MPSRTALPTGTRRQTLKTYPSRYRPGHSAAINADELPAFLAAMDKNDTRLFKPTRIALRLMMLIFLRTFELIEAKWSEIDLEAGEWVNPW